MKKLKLLISVVFIFALIFVCAACDAGSDETATPTVSTGVSDDDYALTLRGLVDADGEVLADVIITKAQIKSLYAVKPVEYTADNPCYASDKQDSEGNLIPHTLKGVYLEDVLAEYTDSDVIDAYGSLTLNASDGYVTIATEEVFNSSGRGSKMIIATEYDGVTLNVNEKSGALRAVFPDQINNTWAKKLNMVEFSTEMLKTPTVTKIAFLEAMDDSCDGEYTINKSVEGEGTANFTYYGKSIAQLITAGLLNAETSDKMYISAWDYNSESDSYSEYGAWTKYDVYSGGYLLNKVQRESEGIEALTRSPVFDGPAFNAGMTVKNVLAVSVFNTAVVSLDTALARYDTNQDGSIWIKDILMLLNMYDEDNSYMVTPVNGTAAELTAEQVYAATITKNGEEYTLTYNGGSVIIKSIAIKIG